jgi:hypothetical protein
MAQASDSLKVLSFHHTNRLTEKIIEAVGKLGCTGALGKAGESMQVVAMNTSEASSTPQMLASQSTSASPTGAGMPRLPLAEEPEPEPVADVPQSEADLAARIGVPVEEWEHLHKDEFDELLKTKTDMDVLGRVESRKIYKERSKTSFSSSRDWSSTRPAEAPVLLNVKLLQKACREGGTAELQTQLQGVLNYWKADRWALQKELGHGSSGVVYSSSDSHQPLVHETSGVAVDFYTFPDMLLVVAGVQD